MPSRRPARRAPRILAIAAAASAALALLAGCRAGGDPFGPGPSATPTTSSSAATPDELDGPFADYFTQTVDWAPCADAFECGTIDAPIDWEHADDARSVPLAAIRHRATDPNPIGTLFVNPGGPGGSGVDFVRDSLDYFLAADVIAHYDVVGWDPRGVGQSDPVTCYTDPADIADFLYYVPTVNADADPEGWVAEQLAVGKRYAEACTQHTGDILQFIDTLSTVRDLELLRAVSGDPQLHYLGYSYGTAIGSIYVDQYPQIVGRVVLDGVVDRQASLVETSVSQQAGFELALTHFVEQCPQLFDDCPFTADTSAGLARIHATLEAFQDHPVTGANGRTMTGRTLGTAIIEALYSESYWQPLNQMFNEVFASRPVTDTAWTLADLYNDFTPGRGFSSNLQDAFLAIYCVDYPVVTDPAVLADMQAQLEAASPTLTLDLPPTPDPVCTNWPYQYRGGQHGPLTGKGAAPVLIVSTTGDPATPYEEGVKLADDLESGVLLTFDGEGHTAYSAFGNGCILDTVDAYLLDGTVPADGTRCEAE